MYIILHIVPCEYKGKKNPPIDCKVVHYTRWYIIIHIWSTTFIQWLHQLVPGTHLVWWSSTCSEIRQHQYQHQHYHACQYYKHQYSDVNVLPMAAPAVWWLEHTVMAGIEHLSLQRAQTIEHCLFHLKLEMILAPILALALSAGAPWLDWLADRNLWLISLDKPRCGSRWRR